jgi:hypothetical protein
MLPSLLDRLLCLLGFHDYRVLEVMFQFSSGGSIEKVECRNCLYSCRSLIVWEGQVLADFGP